MMPEYKALGSPDTLEDAIEVIDELQEHQSRGVRFAPPTIEQILEAVTETGHVEGVSGKVGTMVLGRAGAAGNMLIVRGMTVAKSDGVVLTDDFTPTHEDDVLLLGSDGRKLRELSRLGSGVGQAFGCPVIINESGLACNPVVRVEGVAQANLFYVDGVNNRIGIRTATPSVELEVVGSTRISTALGIGGPIPGGYAFAVEAPIRSRITGGAFAFFDFDGGTDEGVIGGSLPRVTPHVLEFKQRVGFGGGVGFERQAITGDVALPINATYAAISGIPTGPGLTVTLPATDTGAGPGAPGGVRAGGWIVIKDSSRSANTTTRIITISGGINNIDGVSSLTITDPGGSVVVTAIGDGDWETFI